MIFNSDLIADIARQKAIPFLGAGVSASAVTATGGRIKGWRSFLDGLRADADPDTSAQVHALLEAKDYLLASEILKKELDHLWVERIVEEFSQQAEPSALHKAIIDLDQRIVITTNFDKLLEMNWDNKYGNYNRYPQIISDVDSKVFRSLRDHSGKYVIKIHGTVDSPSKIVFSRSQYIFSAFGNASYGSFLESALLFTPFCLLIFRWKIPQFAMSWKCTR